MDGTLEKDCSPLWTLFQQIVTDMKNGTSMWEDFISKANKLQSALKAALTAVMAFLDAFQKVADAATSARGATKDIGTALTRVCLRHRAIENRLKMFISTLTDSLINPLSDRTDDWRRNGASLTQRDLARDCKRVRADLRRRSHDAARHARRHATSRHHSCLQEIAEKRQQLEELEEKAVKAALIEERSRFCQFVEMLTPVVEREVDMLGELGHLQEGIGQLSRHITEPQSLPQATLEMLEDVRAACGTVERSFTLGRRPSDCSLASSVDSDSHENPILNCSTPSSASSDGTISAHRSLLSQTCARWRSRDSGFRSEEGFPLPVLPEGKTRNYGIPEHNHDNCSDAQSINSAYTEQNDDTMSSCTNAWPDLADTAQFERAASAIMGSRPHTISGAYEKGHPRSPLSGNTFSGPSPTMQRREPIYSRPPLPMRCSSLERERPEVPAKNQTVTSQNEHKTSKPNPLPAHLTKGEIGATYVNMSELATMAAARANQENKQVWSESSASESSLESSSGYGSQGHPPDELTHNMANTTHNNTEPVEMTPIDIRDCSSVRDSFSISLSSLEEAVRGLEEISDSNGTYATIRPTPAPKRPLSMAATYGRRGSVGNRPPPPMRRSSTSSKHNYCTTPTLTSPPQQQFSSAEDLPPPPAFLLNPELDAQASQGIKVAETVKQLTELRHTPASPNLTRRNSQNSQFQQSLNSLNQKFAQNERKMSYVEQTSFRTSNSDIYGELKSENLTSFGPRNSDYGTIGENITKTDEIAVKTNDFSGKPSDFGVKPTDYGFKNHDYGIKINDYGVRPSDFGVKPSDFGVKLSDFGVKPDYHAKLGKYGHTNAIYAQPSQIIAGFNSISSSRISENCSPLSLRKNLAARSHSADRRGSDHGPSGLIATLSAKLSPQMSPRLTRRSNQNSESHSKGKGGTISSGVVQPAFLDKLSATIQQQRKQLDSSRASSIRHVINSQTLPDPRICHSSLMEQIKRGANLKRNKHCNDRSAPKIR